MQAQQRHREARILIRCEIEIVAAVDCNLIAKLEELGITEDVTSPTFTLLQSYGSGDQRLHHSDWYRLESEAEVIALGLEDYYDDGMMLIEWGDKFPALLPPGTLRIRIEPALEGSEEIRTIRWGN